MTDSEDIEIRCKTCGKQIAGASATIRASSSGAGKRILSQAKWMMGRLQCEPCAVKDGKK